MLALSDPIVQTWFNQRFANVTEPQRLGWPEIRAGHDVLISAPTGSGKTCTLWGAASELSRRLSRLFLRCDGRRAVYGEDALLQQDPYWRDLILFYEYFHGETGMGLGASHQTGWTALVAKLIEQSGG